MSAILFFLNTDDSDLIDQHGFFICNNPFHLCYSCSVF